MNSPPVGFCPAGEDVIFDYDGLWNTNTPRFSRCFLKTIPALIPALFLWSFTPLEVYFNWYRPNKNDQKSTFLEHHSLRSIPYNAYNVTRMAAVLGVVGVALVQFTYELMMLCLEGGGDNFISKLSFSDFWYSLSNACTFVSKNYFFIFENFNFFFNFQLLLLVILHGQRRMGMHTSGLVFIFTFLTIVFSMPQLYMYLRFEGDDDLRTSNYNPHFDKHAEELRKAQLIFFSIHLSMVIIIFFLSCFSDQGVSLNTNRISDLVTVSGAAKEGFGANNNHNSFHHKQDLELQKKKKYSLTASSGFNGLEPSAHYKPVNGSNTHSRKNSSLKGMSTLSGNVLPSLTSKRLSIAPEVPQKSSPELRASFLSKLTFWWFTPLAIHGYKKSLTMDDLWRLNREDTTAYIAPRADRQWIRQVAKVDDDALPVTENGDYYEFPSIENLKLSKEEIDRLLASPKRPSVVKCLYKTFQLAIWQSVFFKLAQDLVQFISPFLLK